MSKDQRTEARIEVRLEVCLIENEQQHPLHTRDLSNSGVYLDTGGEFRLRKKPSFIYVLRSPLLMVNLLWSRQRLFVLIKMILA